MQLTEKLGHSWDIILWNLRRIVHLRMLSMDFAHEFSSPTPFPDEQLFELAFWNSGKVKEAEWGLFPEKGTGDTKASSRCPRVPGSVSGLDRNILGHQRFVLFFRAAPLACESSQLRVKLELQLPAYTIGTAACDPSHVWDLHHTPHTAHSNTTSLTQWVRPGIDPTSSWILVRFINCWVMKGTPIIRGFRGRKKTRLRGEEEQKGWPESIQAATRPGRSTRKDSKLFNLQATNFLVFFLVFLGPHLWHMEAPRLGAKLELQLLAYHHSHSNLGSEPCLQPTLQLMAT